MRERTPEGLAKEAPILKLPISALEQPVSWLSKEDKPVSLKDFITSRLPKIAKKLKLGASQLEEPAKRINELTEEQLRETVYARLRYGTENTRLMIWGVGDFSPEELVAEVRANTEVGRRFKLAAKRSIETLELLAESGKLRITRDTNPSIKLPDFKF